MYQPTSQTFSNPKTQNSTLHALVYLATQSDNTPTSVIRTPNPERKEKTKSGINFGGGVSEGKMCYGGERLPSKEDFNGNSPTRPTTTARLVAVNENEVVVENLRDRLAETEARLERARAREAELSRQLEEMKRFVSVMEILETYLKRRYREQQDQLCRLFSPVSAKS